MNWSRRVSNYWNDLLRRRQLDRELNDELQAHLEIEIRRRIDEGESPEAARTAALREMRSVTFVREETRDVWGWTSVERLGQDLRYAIRQFRRNPTFTIVAVVLLALSIGANTAIFQLLDAVRLRSLPVKDPKDLVMVGLLDSKGWRGSRVSTYPALTNPVWERFRDTQQTFDGVFAWGNNNFNIAPTGETRLARGLFVSGDFFRVLGVQASLGRVFSGSDDRRGCGLPGAVVSHSYWQRELGGEVPVIGRKILLNFQQVEVIGVTPPDFTGPEVGRVFDVAVPICSRQVFGNAGWLDDGTVWWLVVMGRLKPGETLQQANAQLLATTPALFQATLPSNYPAANIKDYLNFKLTGVPAVAGVSVVRDQYGGAFALLLATTGLILLIACANLANLILARVTARDHEFAVRLAIGASRGRLVRQLMAENILLAAAGTAVAVILSGTLSEFLVALLGTEANPVFLDLRRSPRMLAFAATMAGVTCVLFGLMPAFRASRASAGDAMRASSRNLSATRERFGMRQLLVASQVALSFVLLVSALLFTGSFRNLMTVDAGFRQNGLLIANIDFSRLNIPPEQRGAFKDDLLEKIRGVPGIASAAAVLFMPLTGPISGNSVWIEGSDGTRKLPSTFNWISDGYISTTGMTLLAGRDFVRHDPAASQEAIVNQVFADDLGLGPNPIGKRFRREATPTQPELVFEIVGLVANTKYASLREEFFPIAFLSVAQARRPTPFAEFLIRPASTTAVATSGVKDVTREISPLVTAGFREFEATVREGLLRERLMAAVSAFFGVLASVIAAIGLYGVMSYVVAQRTSEIGIRAAFGATRRDILLLVMKSTLRIVLVGIGAGVVASLALNRFAATLLFGVGPDDPAVMVLAVGLMILIALVATYLPAHRACRVDPMVALRHE